MQSFSQLQPHTAIAKCLYSQIRVILFSSTVLHHHLHGQIERPSVRMGLQKVKRLRHPHRKSLLVFVHLIDETLPINPRIHLPTARANDGLKSFFGISGEQIFGFIERKNQVMICSSIQITKHKSGSSHLQFSSKKGQSMSKPLISIALPRDDVVKGIVGIVVRTVIAECSESQL